MTGTGRVAVAGGTVYEVDGSGPTVVLVHGLGMNRFMWDWQWDALRARFCVVRYDLLGHGESAKPRRSYSMEDFVDQLLGLAEALKLERFALVGFSLGGLIAQAFTLAHPGRVVALAILNAAHDRTEAQREAVRARVAQAAAEGPAATVEAAMERWFTEDFAARRPEVLERVRRWILANDPAVYPAAYRVLAEADAPLAKAIEAIGCPTLVITGEDDRGNAPAMARRMAGLIPGARAEILPGLRHMALAEDPEAVAALLIPFLEGVSGRPGRP